MAKLKKIGAYQLSYAIMDILGEYSDDISKGVYNAGRRNIQDLKERTQATAPIGRRGFGRHYRDSIACKSQKDRLGNSLHTWYVKAPNYRLTHLLVFGHETRKPGKRTKENPFLHNAWDVVQKQYEEDVEKVIRNGK